MAKEKECMIFGYSWEQIQSAQQGGELVKYVDLTRSPQKPQATEDDTKLLAQHGAKGLEDMGFFGVLDRLKNSNLI